MTEKGESPHLTNLSYLAFFEGQKGENSMNILVTGGAGFIGSNVVDGFIEAGHKVIVIDNLSTGRRGNLNPSATFYEMDIRDPGIEKIFKNHNIEIIDHLAAQIDVRKSVTDPLTDAETNVLGGINVLMMAKRFNVKKIVYASTGGAIYGEPKYLPADEAHPIRPQAGYGVSKHALEHYIELFSDLYNLDYTILRYANVYGPRQDPLGEAGVIAIFTGKMLGGEAPIIFGSGDQTRDFVYVGDVVRANVMALTTASKEIINIGTGIETSVNTLYNKMKDIMGFKEQARYEAARPGEVFRITLDAKHAKKALSWEPLTTLDEGMRLTIDFTRKSPVSS